MKSSKRRIDLRLVKYLVSGLLTQKMIYFSSVSADLKKSVSDGKTLVANAITAKGVTTATDATFETMGTNIGNIDTMKFVTGSFEIPAATDAYVTTMTAIDITVNMGLDFDPKYIVVCGGDTESYSVYDGLLELRMYVQNGVSFGNYVKSQYLNRMMVVSGFSSASSGTYGRYDVEIFSDGSTAIGLRITDIYRSSFRFRIGLANNYFCKYRLSTAMQMKWIAIG